MLERKRLNVGLVLAVGCLVLVGVPRHAVAQDKVATTGMQFLEVGVSPRADALGGAFTAIADDASAVYYNPAGMVQLDNTQLMLSHIAYASAIDIHYNFVGIVLPLRVGGVLGLGYYGLDAGDIPLTTWSYPYGNGNTFGAKDYALSVSYGRYLTDRFSVGVTFKVVDELLETERASGWAADVGTIYNTGFRNFKITMMISNFGPNMQHISEDFPLPIDFRFGGAVDLLDNHSHRATLAMEGSHPSDNRERYTIGVEYVFNEAAFFRIGSRFERDLGDDLGEDSGRLLSVGGGLRFDALGLGARLDYGYQDFGLLDQINRYSLTLDF